MGHVARRLRLPLPLPAGGRIAQIPPFAAESAYSAK